MVENTSGTLASRIAELEARLRRMKTIFSIGALAGLGILVVGMADEKKPPPQEITVKKITVVDDVGRKRIVLGQDPKNTQRKSRSAGVTIYDDKGSERGGFGTMADGSVVFAMDAPAGVGAPMRDRLGLVVGSNGSAHIMLIDNETRAVAKLQSDGKGGGGVQVFKWDMDKKKIHVKTFTYDGEKTETHNFGG